jgi:hypothetical protein
MRLRKVLYIKSNEDTPARNGVAVNCFDTDHVFSPRELAPSGYRIIFGNFICDVSEDEDILTSHGRRKVDSIESPTALEPL